MVTFILSVIGVVAIAAFIAGTLYGRKLESEAQAKLQEMREEVRKFL